MTEATAPFASPDQKTIQSFFNSIPERYDFLNSFLSLNLDQYWRKKLLHYSLSGWEKSLLDIGAGTGASLKSFQAVHPFELAVGCDFSEGMLRVAKNRNGLSDLVNGDMHTLPFGNESFDLVTSSFVLRSVKNMNAFLSEVCRVLTKAGKFAFLDLTRPTNRFFWSVCYQPYLNFYLPLAGKVLARNESAYQFLSQSIQTFTEPEVLRTQMLASGFSEVKIYRLTFGAATIYLGEK